jgi:ubiquinone/menaquinone biosynthesis C-methylase UbiE
LDHELSQLISGNARRADLYHERRLTDGYPELESISTEWFSNSLDQQVAGERERVEKLLAYFDRLIGIERVRRIAIIGCGPRPEAIRILDELGYDVVGIEPVESYIDAAYEFLGKSEAVVEGSAEDLPLETESQDVVLLESVLEHVESPIQSLREAFRVLAPGGIALIITTNKLEVSLLGSNAEFHVRFYNWLPAAVKEGYVHQHLHYRPQLANYTPRPAVHWFTFSRLCELGRTAGFAQFYSHVDLLQPDDPLLSGGRAKRAALRLVRASPWLRALALSQVGGLVLMWKRSTPRAWPG